VQRSFDTASHMASHACMHACTLITICVFCLALSDRSSLIERFSSSLDSLSAIIPLVRSQLVLSQQSQSERESTLQQADKAVDTCTDVQEWIRHALNQPMHQLLQHAKDTDWKLSRWKDSVNRMNVKDCAALATDSSSLVARRIVEARFKQLTKMSHDFQTMLDGSPSVKPKVEILKPFHVSRILNKDEWCHALIGWLAPKRLKERPVSCIFLCTSDCDAQRIIEHRRIYHSHDSHRIMTTPLLLCISVDLAARFTFTSLSIFSA